MTYSLYLLVEAKDGLTVVSGIVMKTMRGPGDCGVRRGIHKKETNK